MYHCFRKVELSKKHQEDQFIIMIIFIEKLKDYFLNKNPYEKNVLVVILSILFKYKIPVKSIKIVLIF